MVACARDERGAIMMRVTVPAEARAILTLVPGAGSRVHVAFEEGTQAQWLHDLLQPHAERVVVCNVRAKVCGQGPRAEARRGAAVVANDVRSTEGRTATAVTPSRWR
jgi:hypothetical protein